MKLKVVAAAVALAVASPVFAASSGGYVGVELGQGHSKDAKQSGQDTANLLGASGGTVDESRPAYGIFGGYRFTPYIAAELGYENFGTYHLTINNLGGGSGTLTASDKVSAFRVSAVGIYPVNDSFSVFGKLGMARSKTTDDCTVTGATCPSTTDSVTKPVYGIGASVNVTREFGIGLEYDVFTKVGNKDNAFTPGDFSFVHLNATYSF